MRNMLTLSPTSNTDWKSVLINIENTAHIPGTKSVNINNHQTIIRDMYVDLGDVKNQIKQAGANPLVVIIYADVVRITAGTVWMLNSSALVLVARRIEVESEAQVFLDCRSTQTASFLVFAKEWQGTLETLIVTSTNSQDQPTVFTLDSIHSFGMQIGCRDSQPFQTALDKLQSPMLQEDSDLQLSLTSNFQYAIILSDSQPELAYPILEWIKVCAAQSEAYAHLFLQSSSMLVMLSSESGNVNFVPYLSRTVYIGLAQAFAQTAEDYETQYQRFSDNNEAIEARVEAAKLMLANYLDKTGYDDELIKQCQSNLANAKNALNAASSNMHWQQALVEKAQVALQSGIAQWEYDKKLEAAVTIIGGIIEFAAAAALLCFGDPAAAPAAGGAVAGVAKASAETAETMKKLAKLLEALAKTYAVAEKITQAANSLQDAQKLIDQINQVKLTVEDGEQTSVSDYWAKFKLVADSNLQEAISNEVDGSREYLLALDILVVYGQSMVTNQLAFIRTSQELVRLQLQKQITQNQVKRLQQYIAELITGQQPNDQMMQMMYQRYMDMKISLFIALKNYDWAYKYWALSDSITKPLIVESITTLSSNLADIEQDYATALQSFNPPPQDFSGIQFVTSESNVLQSLQHNATAKWSIGLDASFFGGFDRVRLTTVRVWLDGARQQGNTPVYVMITNSGSYQDRNNGQSYRFTSDPLLRGFQYNANSKHVLVDGKVADEEKYAYFQPTPFTDWTISIPASANKGLDLSGLTQIRMEFAGSLIAEK